MDLLAALNERKSIRAFRSHPIARETIEGILQLAMRAPSAINLQPWEFHVVTGHEKERLSRTLIKAYREKQIPCGPGTVKPLPKTIGKRGAKTLQEMKPFLKELTSQPDLFINEGSCNFYGAPVALLICLDDSFSKGCLVDIGIVLAYLLLAAHAYGVGTCPIGVITAYENEVKDLLNIAENKNLVVGIALGYPDSDSPINRFKSYREPIENLVRWVE